MERLLLLDVFCTVRSIKGVIVLLGGSGILAYMELQGESNFRLLKGGSTSRRL